jgi:hypothetical protein
LVRVAKRIIAARPFEDHSFPPALLVLLLVLATGGGMTSLTVETAFVDGANYMILKCAYRR